MKLGKKYKASLEKVDLEKNYQIEEAFNTLDGFEKAKFDETVDISVKLGIDAKKTDQMVRSSVSLPHGLGKKIRILVFAKGDNVAIAEAAGADFVGAEDMVEKIQGGWLGFDKAIATPDMMGTVAKVGKILGPRSLMPNPKVGTVTKDVKKAVEENKAGKVEFRNEKGGIINAPIGKRSFGPDKLKDNFMTVMSAIQKVKPAAAKGTYIKGVSISATMTPSVRVDTAIFR